MVDYRDIAATSAVWSYAIARTRLLPPDGHCNGLDEAMCAAEELLDERGVAYVTKIGVTPRGPGRE